MSLSRERLGRKTLSPGRIEAIEDMTEAFVRFGEVIENMTKPGREQSLALTTLEECKFWTNQSIAKDGVPD